MPKIHLALAASKTLRFFFTLLYGGAAVILLTAIFKAEWPWEWNIPLFLIGSFAYKYHLKRYILRSSSKAIISLTYLDTQGCWLLEQRDGATFLAKLCADSVLISHISLLNFKRDGYLLTIAVIFHRDATDKNSYRQWRKWWGYYGQSYPSV